MAGGADDWAEKLRELEERVACAEARAHAAENVLGALRDVADGMSMSAPGRHDSALRYDAIMAREVRARVGGVLTVLDALPCATLLVDRGLRIAPEYSRATPTILGMPELVGKVVGDVLIPTDPRQRVMLHACLDQTFDDIFPEEVNLAQLPARVVRSGKVLAIVGSVIRDANGVVDRVLLTITDQSQLESSLREMRHSALLVSILRQRDAFRLFLRDFALQASAGKEAVDAGDQATARRALHTMKGNAATFGLDGLAMSAHYMEEFEALESDHFLELEETLEAFLQSNLAALGDVAETDLALRVSSDAVRDLERILAARTLSRVRVERWAAELRQVPFERLAGALPQLVLHLATRLEKLVDFAVEGGECLVDSARFAPIVAVLPHLLRNALDHGIELPDERGEKPAMARLVLRVVETADAWEVELVDDGRGIQVEKLVSRALAQGVVSTEALATMDLRARLGLVFADNVSTTETATDISGRGIGMGAVASTVRAQGGHVEVESHPGSGTGIRLRVPKPPALVLEVPRSLPVPAA